MLLVSHEPCSVIKRTQRLKKGAEITGAPDEYM